MGKVASIEARNRDTLIRVTEGNCVYIFDLLNNSDTSTKLIKESIKNNGFCWIKNFFSNEEVEILRGNSIDLFERGYARLGSLGFSIQDIINTAPYFEEVLLSKKVLNLAKLLLGKEKTVFTCQSDLHKNVIGSSWHKDSGSYFLDNPFTDPQIKVFKFATYLQPMREDNGLSVKVGSHRYENTVEGNILNLETNVGDLIIFDVRLTHSGQPADNFEKYLIKINQKFKRILSRDPRLIEDIRFLSKLKYKYNDWINKPDRMAIYFTFGSANNKTLEWSLGNIKRQLAQSSMSKIVLTESVRIRLRECGVTTYLDLAN